MKLVTTRHSIYDSQALIIETVTTMKNQRLKIFYAF